VLPGFISATGVSFSQKYAVYVEPPLLFEVPDILQKHRPPGVGGHDILVVGDWTTGIRGQFLFGAHDPIPLHDLNHMIERTLISICDTTFDVDQGIAKLISQ
jgi:hypothetical protein